MLKSRRFLVSLGVTGLFIGLFLYRSNPVEIWQALSASDYYLAFPSVALYLLSMWWRTLRWQVILQPLGRFRTSRLWAVVLVGYAVNNVLPARIGDLARAYYLSKREEVSVSSVLATLLVERVFDALALISLLAIVLPFLPVVGLLRDLGQWEQMNWLALAVGLSVPLVLVASVIAIIAVRPALPRWLLSRLTRYLPGRFQSAVFNSLVRFGAGFSALRNPRAILAIYLLSVPVWLSEVIIYLVLAYGFNIDTIFGHWLNLFGAMVLLTVAANLVSAIPATGGGIGAYEFLVQTTLIFYRVPSGIASAYAIITHAVLLVPETLLGLVYLWVGQVSPREVTSARGKLRNPRSRKPPCRPPLPG